MPSRARRRAARRTTCRWPGATTAGRAPATLGGSIRIIRRPVGADGAVRPASSSSSRQERTWPASTYALAEPPGPHLRAEVELARRRPGPATARARPAARRRASAARAIAGSDSAVASRSSYPTAMPRGDPAERTATSPGSAEQPAPGAARVEGGVDGAVEGPRARRAAGRRGGCRPRCRPRGRRRGSRTTTPGGAAAEVVLGEPDQPGQLAAGGGPGVVEPQQHEDRQVGLAAHRARPAPARATARPSAPGATRCSRSAPPSCAPGHVARVRATATSSSGSPMPRL